MSVMPPFTRLGWGALLEVEALTAAGLDRRRITLARPYAAADHQKLRCGALACLQKPSSSAAYAPIKQGLPLRVQYRRRGGGAGCKPLSIVLCSQRYTHWLSGLAPSYGWRPVGGASLTAAKRPGNCFLYEVRRPMSRHELHVKVPAPCHDKARAPKSQVRHRDSCPAHTRRCRWRSLQCTVETTSFRVKVRPTPNTLNSSGYRTILGTKQTI